MYASNLSLNNSDAESAESVKNEVNCWFVTRAYRYWLYDCWYCCASLVFANITTQSMKTKSIVQAENVIDKLRTKIVTICIVSALVLHVEVWISTFFVWKMTNDDEVSEFWEFGIRLWELNRKSKHLIDQRQSRVIIKSRKDLPVFDSLDLKLWEGRKLFLALFGLVLTVAPEE